MITKNHLLKKILKNDKNYCMLHFMTDYINIFLNQIKKKQSKHIKSKELLKLVSKINITISNAEKIRGICNNILFSRQCNDDK